jgi:hypothetical protein
MPVYIYKDDWDRIGECALGEWELPSQINELEQWLKANHHSLSKGKYFVDIGFQVRKGATGGGGVISIEMIQILNDIGMEIYLSEYNSPVPL